MLDPDPEGDELDKSELGPPVLVPLDMGDASAPFVPLVGEAAVVVPLAVVSVVAPVVGVVAVVPVLEVLVCETVEVVAPAPASAAPPRSLTKVTGIKTIWVPLRVVEVAVVMMAVSVVASEAVMRSRSDSIR